MPQSFNRLANRVEHFVSTFADQIDVPLNFSKELNITLNVQQTDLTMSVHLNQEQFIVPNILRYYKQLKDVKYDTVDYYVQEYGITGKLKKKPKINSDKIYVHIFYFSYVFSD